MTILKAISFVFLMVVVLSCLAFANTDNTDKVIKNLYKEYKETNEMGGCLSTHMDNGTLKISSWYFSNYGNSTFVKFKCSSKKTTMFHTHGPTTEPCSFSEYDRNYFKNHPHWRMSVVFCADKTYKVMYRKTAYMFSDIIEQ